MMVIPNCSMPRKKRCAVSVTKLRFPSIAFVALVLAAGLASAEGLGLGESKEELKLKYDVKFTEHGTGRITVVLTIADEGRLKPLSSVNLGVSPTDGTNWVDLSVALERKEVDGKQLVRVHMHKELAERAEISLRTSHLDGNQEPLTWYYHAIPLTKYMKDREE